MSEQTIKCTCPNCQAKYRLPMEAQGRTARCKKCGEKFEVPRELSLEDSVLTWLSGPNEVDEDLTPASKPRVITMPESTVDADSSHRKGPIRLKPGGAPPTPGHSASPSAPPPSSDAPVGPNNVTA